MKSSRRAHSFAPLALVLASCAGLDGDDTDPSDEQAQEVGSTPRWLPAILRTPGQYEANLVGSGTAWVFTGGKVVKGSWDRPDKEKPAALLDASGSEIELAPGQTWVELPKADYPVTVTP